MQHMQLAPLAKLKIHNSGCGITTLVIRKIVKKFLNKNNIPKLTYCSGPNYCQTSPELNHSLFSLFLANFSLKHSHSKGNFLHNMCRAYDNVSISMYDETHDWTCFNTNTNWIYDKCVKQFVFFVGIMKSFILSTIKK